MEIAPRAPPPHRGPAWDRCSGGGSTWEAPAGAEAWEAAGGFGQSLGPQGTLDAHPLAVPRTRPIRLCSPSFSHTYVCGRSPWVWPSGGRQEDQQSGVGGAPRCQVQGDPVLPTAQVGHRGRGGAVRTAESGSQGGVTGTEPGSPGRGRAAGHQHWPGASTGPP